jgi:hypothetical protein
MKSTGGAARLPQIRCSIAKQGETAFPMHHEQGRTEHETRLPR